MERLLPGLTARRVVDGSGPERQRISNATALVDHPPVHPVRIGVMDEVIRRGVILRKQVRPSLAQGTMFLRNIEGGADPRPSSANHPPLRRSPLSGWFPRPHASRFHLRRFIETSLLGLPPRFHLHRPFQPRPSLAQGTMFLRNIEGGADHLLQLANHHPLHCSPL